MSLQSIRIKDNNLKLFYNYEAEDSYVVSKP